MKPKSVAWALLAMALALRLYLAAQGGALYWTDEKRYLASREAAAAIAERDVAGAAHFLLSKSDHIGFRWLALVPAAIERMVFGDNPPHARICAGFFALFSAFNLFLVWQIARRAGAAEWEAVLALGFAASSNALFFFARHCFPYDAALTFLLGAVWLGLGPARRWQSFLTGLCCGLGYLVYNGYWSVGAVILILEVVWRRETFVVRLRRAASCAAGLLTPLVVLFSAARVAGFDLIADSREFSRTVNQGDFGEGWRFVFEYLVTTDGALAGGLGVLALAGVTLLLVQRRFAPWLRWFAAIVLLLSIWIGFSDIVPKFVLYGRTVRAIVPFLALGAAGAFQFLWSAAGERTRGLLPGAAIALCVGGTAMMVAPLRQMFPVEFRAMAQATMAEAKQHEPRAVFQTLFADYLYEPPAPEALPPHRELLRKTHPQHYAPYLFEGYMREQRPRYLGADTTMRLIQLDTSRGLHVLTRARASQWLAPYPGPLSLRLQFPAVTDERTECVLAHGDDASHPDQLFVRYLGARRLQLGVRHGAAEPFLSDPIDFDPSVEHTLLVSLGSFFPSAGSERSPQVTDLAPWRRRVWVSFDGEVAINQTATNDSRGATLDALRVGAGISRAALGLEPFSGEVRSIRQVDPRNVDAPASAARGLRFGDFLGTVEMTLRLPEQRNGGSEPLLATGAPGAGDLLYISYVDARTVQFGIDHWGVPGFKSAPLPLAAGATQRLVVSFGSLFPSPDNAAYRTAPQRRVLQRWLYVRLNDTIVFSQPYSFYPADADAVMFGRSLPGGSASGPAFTGSELTVHCIAPESLGLDEEHLRWPPVRGERLAGGYLGAVELGVTLPAAWDPGIEPLLYTGEGAQSDVVVVKFRGSKQIQLGFRHGSGAVEFSPSMATAPGARHRIGISMGALLPAAVEPTSKFLEHGTNRRRVVLTLDGKPMLALDRENFPTRPNEIVFGACPTATKGIRGKFSGAISEITLLNRP